MKIELTIPPSANNLYPTGKNGRRFKSAEYKAWILQNGWPLRCEAWAYPPTQPVRVILTIRGGEGFNERRDVASCEKAVTDLLVSCGILKDDSVKYVRENRQVYLPPESEEAKATCTVELFPVGDPISVCKRR